MKKLPNFLLVMTDQQRADSLGYARRDGKTDTPYLDALARRGVIFDNAYSASTVCVPARSSLLTGLFDQRLPRGPDGRALKDGYWTIAHALSARGYQTALLGKTHFSPLGARHGFDVVKNCEHLTRSAGYDPDAKDDYRRFVEAQGLVDRRFHDERATPFAYGTELHPTSWITREAIRFLEERDPDRPYFAVVSYTNPHTPFDPPREYAERYDPAAEPIPADGFEVNGGLPRKFREAFEYQPGDFFHPQRVDAAEPGAVRKELAYMRALVRHIDDSVASLMNHVSLDDTLVFFTSDHGDYGGHRGMLAKVPWIPFDDLAKVPFFAAGAGVEGGRRVASPVQSCDVALTCLDAIGAGPPMPFFDTESLLSTLRGGPASDERAVFCAFSMGWPMVRRGSLKYVWHWSGDQVLFDLDEDPGETRNIAASHARTCEELAIHMHLQMRRPMYELWVNTVEVP